MIGCVLSAKAEMNIKIGHDSIVKEGGGKTS